MKQKKKKNEYTIRIWQHHFETFLFPEIKYRDNIKK